MRFKKQYANTKRLTTAAELAAATLSLESGILVIADWKDGLDWFEITFFIDDKEINTLKEVRQILKMKAFL